MGAALSALCWHVPVLWALLERLQGAEGPMGPVQALPGPAAPLACADPCALWQVQDGRPISFPSLLSHITSMHLNAEALVMPVAQEKPAPPALRSFMPLSTTLPCDFHILNLRMLQAEVSCAPQARWAWLGQDSRRGGYRTRCPQHCTSHPGSPAG